MSIFCSLNSRVAVIGPNGAGKSTMIKARARAAVHGCGLSDVGHEEHMHSCACAYARFGGRCEHCNVCPASMEGWLSALNKSFGAKTLPTVSPEAAIQIE